MRAGVRDEHPFLAVRDFTQGTTILTRHASRVLALFGEATPIHYHDTVRIAQRHGDFVLMTPNQSFKLSVPVV
jgi:hypothetical protein